MSKSILDEYIKRRQNGSAVYNPKSILFDQNVGWNQASQTQQMEGQNGQVPVHRENKWSRPGMIKAPTVTQQIETETVTPPTQSGTGTGALTWDDQIDIEIQNAAKKVLDIANKKFSYSAYESPIYSIMRQEYLKEADLAAGRATEAAAQNAGGFGSSFAVLAGEEARRQVMEGFHNQEDELYAAAQSEFENEKATAFDNYLRLREIQAAEEERLAAQSTTEGGITAGASEAAQYLLNTYGMAYSENAMRQDLLGKGYSEADVNAALESQRKIVAGAVTDYKAGDIGSAISQAGTLDEAYRQGQLTVEEYDAAKAENSKVIMNNVYKGMERIDDTDYKALGFSDEEWSGMKDAEKKLAVLDSVGELAKAGVITSTDFYKLLYQDIDEEFKSDEFKKSKNQVSDVMAIASVIDEYHENGYINDDDYADLMYNQILSKIYGTRFWDALEKQDVANGEDKEYKWISNPFNSLENYDGYGSYGSPEIAKISRSLSKDEKKLLLKLARERRANKQNAR